MDQQQPYQEEIDLIDYIKIIYKHRWIIISVVFISMFFAGISSFNKPKMYEASATFFPMNVNYNIQSQEFTIKPQLDIEDLIISILESRKMADRIIEQLSLKKLWKSKLVADARRKLKHATDIDIEQKGIIRLSVRTVSAELSAKIANAYVDNLEYFNMDLDLGPQRQIVQVIDRAIMPEERMARGTIKNSMLTGGFFCLVSILIIFIAEFMQKTHMLKRLRKK